MKRNKRADNASPMRPLRRWVSRSRGEFHRERGNFLSAFVPRGSKVAVLGLDGWSAVAADSCDTPNALVITCEGWPSLETGTPPPSDIVRLTDGTPEAIHEAMGDQVFDRIVIPTALAYIEDAQATLEVLGGHLTPDTGRLLTCTYSSAWRPGLKLAELVGLRDPAGPESTFAVADLRGLLHMSGYEVTDEGLEFPLPLYVGRGTARINGRMAALSVLRHAGLMGWTEARRAVPTTAGEPIASCSVICCCRNEAGNIVPSVARIPEWPGDLEVIFVDGASTDGTVEEIEEAIVRFSRPGFSVRLIHQLSAEDQEATAFAPDEMLRLGKGDAVRKGLAAASGDICIIMDPELTVPPEVLPKFYEAIQMGRTDFANGTRLIYPMAREAMPLANLLGNKAFGYVFSWLLGHRVTDTLCANKAFRRSDYERIAGTHTYFGDFDPFGDFELLFGAAYLGMQINEVPVRYQSRSAGESKVSVARHGPILGRMTAIGLWQLKIRPAWDRLRKR